MKTKNLTLAVALTTIAFGVKAEHLTGINPNYLQEPIFLNEASTLPLVLLNFDAKRVSNYTQLNWKTTNNQRVAYFLVQRSEDGMTYTDIYEQPARNTTDVELYSVEDAKPINKVAYYRLKSIDKTGVETVSQVVKVGAGQPDTEGKPAKQ